MVLVVRSKMRGGRSVRVLRIFSRVFRSYGVLAFVIRFLGISVYRGVCFIVRYRRRVYILGCVYLVWRCESEWAGIFCS